MTLPVFNEERRLEAGVRDLHGFLSQRSTPFRIDIADNGSTDRTLEIARELTHRFPEVSITQVPDKGVGLALQTSWHNATEDVVGYMDVDLSTDIRHLEEVFQLFAEDEKTIVVNGSRLLSASEVINRPLKREVSSRGLNFLLRHLLNVHFSDGMCGFKFIRREAFIELARRGLTRKDWFFNAELLVRAEWAGMNIREIAVRWTDEPSSNVNIPKLSMQYFKSILALRRERQERTP